MAIFCLHTHSLHKYITWYRKEKKKDILEFFPDEMIKSQIHQLGIRVYDTCTFNNLSLNKLFQALL